MVIAEMTYSIKQHDLFPEKYKLVRVISKFPQGIVSLYTCDNEPIAMKIFERSRIKNKETVYKEIDIFSVARHQHICRFIEEYAHGGDLQHQLNKKGRIASEKEACRLFAHVIRSLEYCHFILHVCHRDVKPEVDFGLACPLSQSSFKLFSLAPSEFAYHATRVTLPLTPTMQTSSVTSVECNTSRAAYSIAPLISSSDQTRISPLPRAPSKFQDTDRLIGRSMVESGNPESVSNVTTLAGMLRGSCGTPLYSAPEVFDGVYDGVQSDIWSSGIVLFCMLTGRVPFDTSNDDFNILARRIRSGIFEIPSYVSENAASLLRLMLSVNPYMRLSHAQIRIHPWCVEHGGFDLEFSANNCSVSNSPFITAADTPVMAATSSFSQFNYFLGATGSSSSSNTNVSSIMGRATGMSRVEQPLGFVATSSVDFVSRARGDSGGGISSNVDINIRATSSHYEPSRRNTSIEVYHSSAPPRGVVKPATSLLRYPSISSLSQYPLPVSASQSRFRPSTSTTIFAPAGGLANVLGSGVSLGPRVNTNSSADNPNIVNGALCVATSQRAYSSSMSTSTSAWRFAKLAAVSTAQAMLREASTRTLDGECSAVHTGGSVSDGIIDIKALVSEAAVGPQGTSGRGVHWSESSELGDCGAVAPPLPKSAGEHSFWPQISDDFMIECHRRWAPRPQDTGISSDSWPTNRLSLSHSVSKMSPNVNSKIDESGLVEPPRLNSSTHIVSSNIPTVLSWSVGAMPYSSNSSYLRHDEIEETDESIEEDEDDDCTDDATPTYATVPVLPFLPIGAATIAFVPLHIAAPVDVSAANITTSWQTAWQMARVKNKLGS